MRTCFTFSVCKHAMWHHMSVAMLPQSGH